MIVAVPVDPLEALRRQLDAVLSDDSECPSRVVRVGGPRRVGKSRVVQQFVSGCGLPYVYFTAAAGSWHDEPARFVAAVGESELASSDPRPGVESSGEPGGWASALSGFAALVPGRGAVLVVDEAGLLEARDEAFRTALDAVLEGVLGSRRTLIVLIGSRRTAWPEVLVPPMSPTEVTALLGLGAADGIDAWLVSGGLPGVLVDWPEGRTALDYVAQAVEDPTTSLVVTGERLLAAEFGAEAQARAVLGIVGQGERTFSGIGRAATGLQQASLNRTLGLLADRGLVTSDVPLSTRPAPREKRYQVADPYLSFWLRFLGSYVGELERGRADRVLARIRAGFGAWRALAVEPLARASLTRLLLDPESGTDPYVGGYWTRADRPRIELVLADRGPTAGRVLGVGAVKWADEPFTAADLAGLVERRQQLPGGEGAPMVVVSRAGVDLPADADGWVGADVFPPEDLLTAW